MGAEKDVEGNKGGGGGGTRRKNPRAGANPLSALTFCWTIPTFYRGLKSDFLESDLTEALKEHSSSYLGNKIEKEWENELEKSRKMKNKPSLLRVVVKVFGPRFMLYAIPIFISELILRISQPLLLGKLIQYFLPGNAVSENDAYMYALGVALCSVFSVLLTHPHMQSTMHIGMKLRVAMSNLIYSKALRVNKMSRGKMSTGRVINLMSNDVGKFDLVFLFLHMLWMGPLQTLIVTYLVWQEVGVAALVGIVTILLAIPFQGFISKHASSFRMKTSYRTDERIRIMNEIISGIQVIKMYTWEMPFIKLVNEARQKEINEIIKLSYLKGVLLSFIVFHVRVAFFATILTYVLLGNSVSSEKIFVVIALINTLRQTMTVFFPQGLFALVDALVSIRRISDFLVADENVSNPNAVIAQEKEALMSNGNVKQTGKYDRVTSNIESLGIKINDASAKWDEEATENSLTGITVEVKPKELTVVIGPVGAGKTSLLHAVLNELVLTSGSITVSGSISYCSQEPWLYSGTVRDNILFGSPYDRDRYRQIIRVCSLKKDLELFPYGDKTIVGERGTTLSGGQRARINLARAVYKNSDVYLLDDPLSAVDAHVGKHLFEDCIQTYLRSKTVILVTHQVQFLEKVDQIVLLQNGTVRAKGTYHDLRNSGLDFTKLLAAEQEEQTPHPSVGDDPTVDASHPTRGIGSRHSSIHSAHSHISDISKIDPAGRGEVQAMGSVNASIYRKYIQSLGNCCMILVMLLSFVLSQMMASAGDYWISLWINIEERYFSVGKKYYSLTRQDFVLTFSGLTIGVVVVTLARSFLFFRMCMRSSMKLHNAMFGSIIRATMSFFTSNSSGRILNRFSKDIGIIDELLPQTLIDVLQIALALIGIIAIVAIVNFWLLIPTAVCFIIFYFFRVVYVSTARGVKRVEGICRSPVYAHINSTLQGLTTIRAFGAEQQVLMKFHETMDLHSSAWFLFITTSRAFGYWLDLVCACYITIVTVSFLFLDLGVSGSDVGLAITQAVAVTGMFQWGMRQSAELENCMTSVERVCEYSELESEPDLESTADKKPDQSWPNEGKIQFQDVFLRYATTDPWVLKNLSFTVQPQEKVGIVGRTGAGKSSLIGALFRLTDVSGQIIVDGIDIATIGLHDLRSKVSIIPQEPMLFAGTMRKNLDPFDEFTDAVIWDSLEQVELKEAIKEMPQALQTVISEGGVNLSIGQRQLVCLARALLRRNRVLVLDEATANVDPQTDALIQKTIRDKFKECTVLTIAHRLNTVMDSDRVLVMSAGSMVEFDQPHKLLQDPHGYFYGLVQQTGAANEEMLHKLAAEAQSK